jgi:hypothetical protein
MAKAAEIKLFLTTDDTETHPFVAFVSFAVEGASSVPSVVRKISDR